MMRNIKESSRVGGIPAIAPTSFMIAPILPTGSIKNNGRTATTPPTKLETVEITYPFLTTRAATIPATMTGYQIFVNSNATPLMTTIRNEIINQAKLPPFITDHPAPGR
ncbi:MAG: hypothetical protein M1424_04800 [Candidatus Thermoplasmatota archaeon]|nr:hypothetical protein [Candidatus Thermoplasmatota archaeon]